MKASRVLLALLAAPLVLGNAPAPYWACNGLAAGDRCEPYGSGSTGCWHDEARGACVVQQGCVDSPDTAVNECLYCRE